MYLWPLWPLCIKWISISVGTDRHVVLGRSRVSYSPRELKAIRISSPRTRLPTGVWECIKCLGIRKPNRSRSAGYRKKRINRSKADSMKRGPCNVMNSNLSKEEEQGQHNVRFPASIPSVIYANIRSVTSKIDELQTVVSINNSSIVCLTETWLNSNIPNSACDLTDFICYRNDRLSAMGGGVCVYVKTFHPCNRLQEFEEIEIESVWLKIRPHRLPRGTSSLLVAAVYHPPSSSAEQNSILIAHLQKNTESYLASYPEGMVIITGDFNPTSTRIKLSDVTMATGLRQIVTVPTRNDSILDWCFTNKPKLLSKPVQLPRIGSCDHNALLVKPVNVNQSSIVRAKSKILRDTRGSRLRDFGAWITSYDWSAILNISEVQAKFDLLHSCLMNAVDTFFPTSKVKISATDKPWITSSLKLLIIQRQKALAKWGKTSVNYKRLRNRVQEACSKCKKRFYENKVSGLQDSTISRWWKHIKELGGLSCSGDWSSQLIGNEIPDEASLALKFNEFLGSLTAHFRPLEPLSPVFGPVPAHLYVSESTMYKTLRALKVKKSPGPELIPNIVWKEFAFELSPVLADIYNSSLEQGYVPTQLKQAIVVPIPKCRPPMSVESDLRPLSLTSPVAKVLEGFSAKSLLSCVWDKLDRKQFALPGRSTTQALVYLLHTILESIDGGEMYVRMFFSDFSKGFDLVDHNVLLRELDNMDVDPHLLRWIASFLTNRNQRVRVRVALSPPIWLNGGTPQGTKLAPLLFCILVNRMASNCINRVKYVDDATVVEFVPRLSPSYLNFTVSDIYSFASSRGMVLNSKKCKEMCISFLKYRPFPPVPLLVGSSLIEKVPCYKLLGVHVSDNLTWNEHVTYIVKKGSKRLYALRVLKKSGLNDRQLILVYCSIIRSVLEYASPAWAGLTQYLSDHIESVQKRALRIIFPHLCYVEALRKSGLLSLRQRREDACITFLQRSYSSSHLLRSLVPRVAHTRPYALRSGESVSVPVSSKTNRFGKFCTIKYQNHV